MQENKNENEQEKEKTESVGALESDEADNRKTEEEETELETLTFGNAGGEAESGEEATAKKKTGMVKKQKIMLICFASAAVVLLLVYIFALHPLVKKLGAEEEEPPEELLEGEARDTDGRSILIFPHVEKKDVQQITVENSNGGFTCVREGDGFYIKEHPQSPLDETTFTQLVVDAAYPIIVRRITTNCEDFSIYGLGEDDNPACVTVTTTGNQVYTYYIGDLIPSGGGYYCRYKDRNALYVIPSSTSGTLLASSESLITPVLGITLTEDQFLQIEELILQKNGQPFVSFRYKENTSGGVVQSAYEMIYPAAYVVNDDNVSSTMLASLATLEGYTVVAAGDGTPEGLLYKNDKIMAEFGFYDVNNPAYELYYKYGEYESIIMFTDSGADDYYFAYSYIYDTIVLVEKSKVPYLEWDLLEYVSNNIFQEYIKDVNSIKVTGKLDYKQEIHDIYEKFFYSFDEDEILHCRAESTNYQISGNTISKNPIQAFYQTALRMKILGYASEENFDMSSAEEYARMEIGFSDGKTRTYVFYRFAGYCYFEIDGEGEFYTSLTNVNKLLIDAVRAANGAVVTPTDEYADLPDEYLPRVDGRNN